MKSSTCSPTGVGKLYAVGRVGSVGNWCRKFGIYACLLLPAGFIAVESVNAALSTEEKERVERLAREKPSIDLELLFGYRSARIERENMAAFEELGRALS